MVLWDSFWLIPKDKSVEICLHSLWWFYIMESWQAGLVNGKELPAWHRAGFFFFFKDTTNFKTLYEGTNEKKDKSLQSPFDYIKVPHWRRWVIPGVTGVFLPGTCHRLSTLRVDIAISSFLLQFLLQVYFHDSLTGSFWDGKLPEAGSYDSSVRCIHELNLDSQ